MENNQFWVRRGGKTFGPFGLRQIQSGTRAGKLMHSDELSPTSGGPWKTLAEMLPSLDSLAAAVNSPVASGTTSSRTNKIQHGMQSNSLQDEVAQGKNCEAAAPRPARVAEPNRPSIVAGLAYKWHQLPVAIRVTFYLVIGTTLALALSAKARGNSGYDDAMRLALTVGCVALGARFLISEYCLPSPGDSFYLRSDEGVISGPFSYEDADALVASRDGRELNRISKDAAGPWLFWLEALVEEKNQAAANSKQNFVALLTRLYSHEAVRLTRYLFWGLYALCVAVYFACKQMKCDTGNVVLKAAATVFELGPMVAVGDLALVFQASPLGRCWQRYITKSNAADAENREREAASREEKLRREAHEAFLRSELVTKGLVRGSLMHVQGVSCRNTPNDTATMTFERDCLHLLLPGGVHKTLSAVEIESVLIGGRGKFSTSVDNAWMGGGFGMTGAIKGALNAAALNYLTSLLTKQDHCECLIHVKWKQGEVILLNTFYEPSQAWSKIGPIVDGYAALRG